MHVGVGVDPLNGMLHQVLVMDSCGSAKVCRTGHVFVAAAVASAGTGYFSGCIRASLINVASWLDVGIGFTDRPGEISLPLRNWRVVVCRLIPDRGRHTYQIRLTGHAPDLHAWGPYPLLPGRIRLAAAALTCWAWSWVAGVTQTLSPGNASRGTYPGMQPPTADADGERKTGTAIGEDRRRAAPDGVLG